MTLLTSSNIFLSNDKPQDLFRKSYQLVLAINTNMFMGCCFFSKQRALGAYFYHTEKFFRSSNFLVLRERDFQWMRGEG